VSKTKQADGEIHEDQLLNFLVNRLDEEVSASLANNAEITAEDIYEGPSSALAPTGTSVSTLCASSQNSPAGNTVLYHLRRSSSRNGSNESLTRPAKGSDELFPEQVEVCADLHLRPLLR